MGKGIALEFKMRYPFCFPPYAKACRQGSLKPGDVLYIENSQAERHLKNNPIQISFLVKEQSGNTNFRNAPDIVHFATKDHWRGKSKIEWIEMGLPKLQTACEVRAIKSIALPQLGCGLGGLKWQNVRAIIERQFASSPMHVYIFGSAVEDYGEQSATD